MDYGGYGMVSRVDAATGILDRVRVNMRFATGVALDDAGNVWTADFEAGTVGILSVSSGLYSHYAGSAYAPRSLGDGGPATEASFDWIMDVDERAGRLYVLDGEWWGSSLVRAVDVSAGTIEGMALEPSEMASPSLRISLAVGPSGEIFMAGGGFFFPYTILRARPSRYGLALFAGGGRRAPREGAAGRKVQLFVPNSLDVDAAGDLYALDMRAGVLKFDGATGTVEAVGSDLRRALAVGVDDEVYTATQYQVFRRESRRRWKHLAGSGAGYSGDGGPATLAGLDPVLDIDADANGNVYILGGNRVRRVDARTGIIETIAGDGVSQYAGDSGPARSSRLDRATRLAVDRRGVVYVSSPHGVVRAIVPAEPAL